MTIVQDAMWRHCKARSTRPHHQFIVLVVPYIRVHYLTKCEYVQDELNPDALHDMKILWDLWSPIEKTYSFTWREDNPTISTCQEGFHNPRYQTQHSRVSLGTGSVVMLSTMRPFLRISLCSKRCSNWTKAFFSFRQKVKGNYSPLWQ